MKTAKGTCKCGEQVAYIEEFVEHGDFQQREFDLLTEQGYDVIIGEDLPKSPPCLEPCFESDDCAFKNCFSTKPGFHNVYTRRPKSCSQSFGKELHSGSSGDTPADDEKETARWWIDLKWKIVLDHGTCKLPHSRKPLLLHHYNFLKDFQTW